MKEIHEVPAYERGETTRDPRTLVRFTIHNEKNFFEEGGAIFGQLGEIDKYNARGGIKKLLDEQ